MCRLTGKHLEEITEEVFRKILLANKRTTRRDTILMKFIVSLGFHVKYYGIRR